MTFLFPKISEYLKKFSSDSPNNLDLHEKNDNNSDSDDVEYSLTTSVRIRRKNSKNLQHHVVEVCLSDIESARNAVQGGATSLELCTDRTHGGVTPSIGLVRQCVNLCKGTNIEINVLVRPRAGFFTYSHEEFDVILRDIIAFEKAGVTGIVVGILKKNGHVDVERMRIIKQLAKDMKITFHRAFDVCTQPITDAIDAILSIPCDRILTSGRQTDAYHGQSALKDIVYYAEGMIEIIAGAGINQGNVDEIIRTTHVQGVHVGSAVTIKVHHEHVSSPVGNNNNNNTNILSAASRSSSTSPSSTDRLSENGSLSCEPNIDSKLEMSWMDVKNPASEQIRSATQELGSWDIVCANKLGSFLEVVHKSWEVLRVNSGAGLHRSSRAVFEQVESGDTSHDTHRDTGKQQIAGRVHRDSHTF